MYEPSLCIIAQGARAPPSLSKRCQAKHLASPNSRRPRSKSRFVMPFHDRHQLVELPLLDQRPRLGNFVRRLRPRFQDGFQLCRLLVSQGRQRGLPDLAELLLEPLAALVRGGAREPLEEGLALLKRPAGLQIAERLDVLHLLFLRRGPGQ